MATKKGAVPSSGCLAAPSNPMLNSLVVQALFEYASLVDLEDWRNVCKLWYEESLPRWRREIWVKVSDNEEEEDGRLFLGKYMDLTDDDASSSEDDFYRFQKHPIRRFKFASCDLRTKIVGKEIDSARQGQFWQRFGSQLTHLEIKDSNFRTSQTFSSIIYGSVPNLEVLRLLGNRFPYHPEDHDNPEWDTGIRTAKVLGELQVDLCGGSGRFSPGVYEWFVLLGFIPNIKSIKLENTGSELIEIFKIMWLFQDDVQWEVEKLDLLEIESMRLVYFRDDICDFFWRLQLPLTELSLDIGKETWASSFKRILETHAVTLRKLVVYRESGSGFENENGIVQCFPFDVQLSTLSELWMVGAAVPQNLHFLKFIPNLQRLLLICNMGNSLIAAGSHLCDQKTLLNLVNGRTWTESDSYFQNSIVADTDFRQLENLVCSELEEFIVSGTKQGYCNPKHVAALAGLMPNLKRVMLGLDKDGFRVLCENWKDLETFVVQPYAVDEFGITGIIPGLKNYPRLPNLTDLKSLRYFGMGYDHDTLRNIKVGLSYNSYVNGILELPKLQDLTVACANEMSAAVRFQIMSRFPNGRIHAEKHKVREWDLNNQSAQTRSNVVSSGISSASSDHDSNVSDDESSSGVSYNDVVWNEDHLSADESGTLGF